MTVNLVYFKKQLICASRIIVLSLTVTFLVLYLGSLNLSSFNNPLTTFSSSSIHSGDLVKQQNVANSFINSNICIKQTIYNTQFPKTIIANQYKLNPPIIIDDNDDFSNLGFNGSGTFNDPYRIEGLNITSSMGYLIEIKNTTAWFIIRNNLLDGLNSSFGGIDLRNVTHGIISNNIIRENDQYGIYIAYSSNDITVINNTLYNNSAGIGVVRAAYNSKVINNTVFNNLKWNGILTSYNAHDNIIVNNTAFNSGWHGILLWGSAYNNIVFNNTAYNNNNHGIWIANYCSYNTIINNTFYGNGGNGISLGYSDINTISNNYIYNNNANGIDVHGASNNIISNNNVNNNTRSGIAVTFDYGNYFASINNTIEANLVSDNGNSGISLETYHKQNAIISNIICRNHESGILLFNESINNLIAKNIVYSNFNGILIQNSNSNHIVSNTISNNSNFGISIETAFKKNATLNFIEQNNFVNNFKPQAQDSGSKNIFMDNFWDDWLEPDAEGDGIVDEPYAIMGIANNMDLYPSVRLIDITHWLSRPEIIKPISGETINGSYAIQWTEVNDPLDHDITYAISLSSDNGETWIQIISGLTSTDYIWDTTKVNNGASYLLMIKSTCSAGKSVSTISQMTFRILNTSNKWLNNLVISLVAALAAIFIMIGIGYLRVRNRFEKPKSFSDLLKTAQLDFLNAIYQKVVTALDNISLTTITNGIISESIDVPSIDTTKVTTLTDYFPPEYREDLKSEMKGRTVLALIEIACNYPNEITLTKLSKILDVPISTLSNEIKRLRDLQYIEYYAPALFLHDARYKSYSVTPKGHRFLYTLKIALELSIARLKETRSMN
jgi:parallel beta-helix repeat protein